MASTCSAKAPQVPIAAEDMILSRTYESSQLHTPQQLERITIDDPHFQGYLSSTGSRNVRLQKPKIMGDKYFFLQKDIPVHQIYTRTSLKLSEVRPWDQIVDPPLKRGKILSKELTLPFPRQHPFASHTSQFAMFPDTQPYCRSTPTHDQHQDAAPRDDVRHVQTQTTPLGEAIGVPHPPFLYYVAEKATKHGLRVEHRYINSSPGVPLAKKSQEILLEYPGCRRHQRSSTYPAPSIEYSRPPTTPHYLPPPSTMHFSQPGTPGVPYTPAGPNTISRNTQSALDTIHSAVSRSTTYGDHFTPRAYTQLQPNRRTDYSINSRLSQRPWTDESRGKYNSDFPVGPLIDPLLSDDESEEDEESEERTTAGGPGQEEGVASPGGNVPESTEETSAIKETEVVQKCDASTQTDEAFFTENITPQEPPNHISQILPPTDKTTADVPSGSPPTSPPARNPIDSLTARLYKFPLLDQQRPATERGNPVSKLEFSPRRYSAEGTKVQSPRGYSAWGVGGDLSAAQKQDLERRRSLSQPSVSHKLQSLSRVLQAQTDAQVRTPRTVESTRRMMQVFNRFSRSESMRRFHQHYQESAAPDLRVFSIREGKRHIIHGTHAYYYH